MDSGRPALIRAVVDTNVLAYALLGGANANEAERLLAGTELTAPGVWEAELANTLWVAIRHRVISIDQAGARLRDVARLGIRTVPSRKLWQGALLRSMDTGIAVYDTLFVELAEREQIPLATFDGAVLKAFPGIAARPGALTR